MALRGRGERRGLAGRLLSPAGLLLAAACLAMPFLTVSCQGPVELVGDPPPAVGYAFSGADLVTGGWGDLSWRTDLDGDTANGAEAVDGIADHAQQDAGGPPPVRLGRQPLAILAVVVIALGVLGAAPRRPIWRAVAGAVAGLIAGGLLVATEINARAQLSDAVSALLPSYVGPAGEPAGDAMVMNDIHVRPAYGFWACVTLLGALALGNLAALLLPRPDEGDAAPAGAEPAALAVGGGGTLVHRDDPPGADGERDLPAP